MEFINHHYLNKDLIVIKDHQKQILEQLDLEKNGLIMMPTGSGKTIILILLIIRLVGKYKRILVVAPKIVLIQQHFEKLTYFIRNLKIILVLSKDPGRLSFLNQQQVVVISTPHLISNEKRRIGDFFSVICFDEVHNIHYSYPYLTFMNNSSAKMYGFTASISGSSKLKKVSKFLKYPRVYELKKTSNVITQVVYVQLDPGIKQLVILLNKKLGAYMKHIKLTNVSYKLVEKYRPNYIKYNVAIKCIKLNHFITLLSTQPITLAKKYLSVTGLHKLVLKTDLQKCYNFVKYIDKDIADAKVLEITRYLNSAQYKRCIIFTKYVQTAKILYDTINVLIKFLLLGQNKQVSRVSQIEILNKFKNSDGVLVSTSVGYQGVDIPQTDLIIVYECTQTNVQFIQQRGRTARDGESGKVVYFIYRGTLEDIKVTNKINSLR